ncbi:hypothetical protein BYT27DRAFT_7190201 [Phlegmacium glaucopus]|nr:hypothetical protein BYT27DRAFT_7190201 [Phlegmacium glaucopus]
MKCTIAYFVASLFILPLFISDLSSYGPNDPTMPLPSGHMLRLKPELICALVHMDSSQDSRTHCGHQRRHLLDLGEIGVQCSDAKVQFSSVQQHFLLN